MSPSSNSPKPNISQLDIHILGFSCWGCMAYKNADVMEVKAYTSIRHLQQCFSRRSGWIAYNSNLCEGRERREQVRDFWAHPQRCWFWSSVEGSWNLDFSSSGRFLWTLEFENYTLKFCPSFRHEHQKSGQGPGHCKPTLRAPLRTSSTQPEAYSGWAIGLLCRFWGPR